MYKFANLLEHKDLTEYLVKKTKPSLVDLEHALAIIASQPLVKNANGLISPSLSIRGWPITDLEFCGIMKLFIHPKRADILVGTAISGNNPLYSALTPLVLAAFKKYNNIDYAAWDWSDTQMRNIVDATIMELQPYILNPLMGPKISVEDKLLMVEELGMPATSIWSPKVPELKKYPRLLKVIELQTWVAHPSVRNKWMILSIDDIDSMPPSIYGDTDININNPFITYVESTKKATIADGDLPWSS